MSQQQEQLEMGEINVSGDDVMVGRERPRPLSEQARILWLSEVFRRTDRSKVGNSRRAAPLAECWDCGRTARTARPPSLPICSHAHCPNPGTTHAASPSLGLHKNVKSTLVPNAAFLPYTCLPRPLPLFYSCSSDAESLPCLPCAISALLCASSRLSPAVGKHKSKSCGVYGARQARRAGRTVGR